MAGTTPRNTERPLPAPDRALLARAHAPGRELAGRSLESLHREPEVLVVRVPVGPPQRVVGIAEPDPEAAHQGLFALGCCRARGGRTGTRTTRTSGSRCSDSR